MTIGVVGGKAESEEEGRENVLLRRDEEDEGRGQFGSLSRGSVPFLPPPLRIPKEQELKEGGKVRGKGESVD